MQDSIGDARGLLLRIRARIDALWGETGASLPSEQTAYAILFQILPMLDSVAAMEFEIPSLAKSLGVSGQNLSRALKEFARIGVAEVEKPTDTKNPTWRIALKSAITSPRSVVNEAHASNALPVDQRENFTEESAQPEGQREKITDVARVGINKDSLDEAQNHLSESEAPDDEDDEDAVYDDQGRKVRTLSGVAKNKKLRWKPIDEELTDLLERKIQERYRAAFTLSVREKQYDAMRMLRERGAPNLPGPIPKEKIYAAIGWLGRDDWWIPQGNIQSVFKFRTKFAIFDQRMNGKKNRHAAASASSDFESQLTPEDRALLGG